MPPVMNGSTCSFSDQSEGSSPEQDPKMLPDHPDDICRDYLRNVCKRGKRCKYRHPTTTETIDLGQKHDYTFCHDFQNSGCRRANCRFIHCTREEEEYYKQTGQLPVRVQQAAALGVGIAPNEVPLLQGEVPICKDFLKGDCKRAGRCKYRHLTAAQYELELHTRKDNRRPLVASPNTTEIYTLDEFEQQEYEQLGLKRRRIDETFNNYAAITPLPTVNILDTFRTLHAHTDYRLLEDENNMLRRKVEELKKQVSDLAATNEVLLEQNARYRTNKATTVVTACPPIVTVSQVVTPTITHAPTIARPPVLQAITSMTTNPQITVSANHANELVVSQNPTLQPRLAGDITQVSFSVAPINQCPVTVALSSLVPMTLDTALAPRCTTLAPAAAVSLSQTTLPSAAPAGGSTCTLLQAGSGPTTTLVSYPIVSHTMNPLPNSSLG